MGRKPPAGRRMPVAKSGHDSIGAVGE